MLAVISAIPVIRCVSYQRSRVQQVRWHARGGYGTPPNAQVLIDDGQGGVVLWLDERNISGALLTSMRD